jgi:hypothetical protein
MLEKIKNIELGKLDENESIKLIDEIINQDYNDIKKCVNCIIDYVNINSKRILFYEMISDNDKIKNILNNLFEIELKKSEIEEKGYCQGCKNNNDGIYNINCDTCEHLVKK